MEANEAPEKIYLQVCGDCQDNECDNCKFEDLEDNVTWCKDKIFDKDVEYTRTDAFIDKVCELLTRMIWEVTYEDLEGNSIHHYDKMEFIEEFKKAMEEQ